MLDLSKLSGKEKEEALKLLKGLGVDVSDMTKKKRPTKKLPTLKAYINCYENYCLTCKNIEHEYYRMQQAEGTDFLRGLPIHKNDIDDSLEIKTNTRKLNTCSSCYTRLEKLPKIELIRMLIKEKLKWI